MLIPNSFRSSGNQTTSQKIESLKERARIKHDSLNRITSIDNPNQYTDQAPDPYEGTNLTEYEQRRLQLANAYLSGREEIAREDAPTLRQFAEEGSLWGQTKQIAAFVADRAGSSTAGVMEAIPAGNAYSKEKKLSQSARNAGVQMETIDRARLDKLEADRLLLLGTINKDEHARIVEQLQLVQDNNQLTPEQLEELHKPVNVERTRYRSEGAGGFSRYANSKPEEAEIPTQMEYIQSSQRSRDLVSQINKRQQVISDLVNRREMDKQSAQIEEGIKQINAGEGSEVDKLMAKAGVIVDAIKDNPLATLDRMSEAGVELGAIALAGGTTGVAVNVGESVDGAIAAMYAARDAKMAETGQGRAKGLTDEELENIRNGFFLHAGADAIADALSSRAIFGSNIQKFFTDPGFAKKQILRAAEVTGVTASEMATGAIQNLSEQTYLKGTDSFKQVDRSELETSAVNEALGVGGLSAAKNSIGSAKDAVGTVFGKVSSETKKVTDKVGEEAAKDKKIDDLKQTAANKPDANQTVKDGLEGLPAHEFIATLRALNTNPSTSAAEKQTNIIRAKDRFNALLAESNAAWDEADKAEEKYGENSKEHKEKMLTVLKLREQLDLANDGIAAILQTGSLDKGKADNLANEVASAQELTPEVEQATAQLFSVAQVDPDALTVKQARKIAQSKVLSEGQRAQMQAFVAAREAEQQALSIDSVQEEVLYGGKGTRKGLRQHRDSVVVALAQGDLAKAKLARDALKRFVDGHAKKASDFTEAFAPYQKASDERKPAVLSERDKELIAYVADHYKQKNGKPVGITAGSRKLVEAVNAETVALQAGLAEADAMLSTVGIDTNQLVVDAPADNAVPVEVPASVESAPVNVKPVPENGTKKPAARKPAEVVPDPLPEEPAPEQVVDNSIPDDYADYADTYADVESERVEPLQDEAEVTTNVEQPTAETQEEVAEDSTADEAEQATVEPEVEAEREPTEREKIRARIDVYAREVRELRRRLKSKAELNKLDSDTASRAAAKEALELTLQDTQSRLDAYRSQLARMDEVSSDHDLTEQFLEQSAEDVALEADDSVSADEKYKTMNLVARYFVRRSDAARQFLVKVQDGIGKLKEDPEAILSFTGEEQLSDKGRQIISDFTAFHDRMVKSFDALYKPKTEHRYDSYIHYLADAEGNIPENVKVAISAAVYEWIVTSAKGTMRNDDLAINRILGRDKKARITKAQYRALAKAGTPRSAVIDALGRDIVRAIGIEADAGAPSNVQGQLERSVGQMAVTLLLNEGLVTQKNVGKAILGNAAEGDHDVSFLRVRMEDEDNYVARADIEAIAELNRDSGGFFGKMFFNGYRATSPKTVKPSRIAEKQDKPAVKETMKGTFQKLNDRMMKILGLHQDRAHSISPITHAAFTFLPRTLQERVAGVVHDTSRMHEVLAQGVEGKNAGLLRELDNYGSWTDYLKDNQADLTKPFYFTHRLWSNMRVGMEETLVNPQRSKLHRALIRQNDWIGEVDTTNKTHLNNFLLAVAEGLGIGTDKLDDEDGIAQLNEKLKDPVIQAGIESLTALRQLAPGESFSPEKEAAHQEAIVKAVEAGGENAHSLHALTNYAVYASLPEGQTTFTADISREIDGVTNGPIIASLQYLGHQVKSSYGLKIMKEVLNKGGIFFGSETSLGKWLKEKTNWDSYEDFALLWDRELKKLLKDKGKQEKLTIMAQYFDPMLSQNEEGELIVTGRKFSKGPLMTTIYAVSEDGLNGQLTDTFIENLYKEMETIHNDAELSEVEKKQALDNLAADVNALAGENILEFKTIASALTMEFTGRDAELLKAAVKEIYGDTAQAVIKTKFKYLMKNRDALSESIQVTTQIFKAMYNDAVERRTTELREAGELSKFESLPKAEITAIQEQLREAMPILRTHLSGEELESGLYIGKTKKVRKATDANKTQTVLEGELEYIDTDTGKKFKVKSISSNGAEQEIIDPGVKGGVVAIHSLDATIAMLIMEKVGVVGVHDGFIAGIFNALKVGKVANQAFHETMLNNSMLEEADTTLNRALKSLEAYEAEHGVKLLPNIQTELGKLAFNKKTAKQSVITKVQKEVGESAKRISKGKNWVLNQVKHVLQYNIEGGGFTPEHTEEGELTKPEEEVNIDAVPEAIQEPARDELIDPTLGDDAEFDKQYKPNKALYNAIRKITEQSGQAGVDSSVVIDALVSQLSKRKTLTQNEQGHLVILKRIRGMGLQNVNVVYLHTPEDIVNLTPNEQIANMLKMQPQTNATAMALHVPGQTGSTIYLKGPAFEIHGSSNETVIHELLHAATSSVLNANTSDPRMKKVKFNLNVIIGAVNKYLADPRNAAERDALQLGNALNDPGELVSWGMTNKAFQELLKKVEVNIPATANKGRKITDAFTHFVDTLRGIFFSRSNSAKLNSAFNHLIESTGEVLDYQENALDTPPWDISAQVQAQQYSEETKGEQLREKTQMDVLSELDQSTDPEQRSAAHKATLMDVQRTIQKAISGPLGIHLRDAEDVLGDDTDQFLRNLRDGTRTFSSNLRNTFRLSYQESYLAEQIEAVMGNLLDNHSDASKEIQRMWDLAQGNLRMEDFLPNPALERTPENEAYFELAQLQYDEIFTPRADEITAEYSEVAGKTVERRKSNHLHRFAALAMTHEPFQKKLAALEAELPTQEDENLTIVKRIHNAFNKLLNTVNNWLHPTRNVGGDDVNARVNNLMKNLAEIQFKHKRQLAAKMVLKEHPINAGLNDVITRARNGIEKLGRKAADSNNPFVGAAGTAVETLAGGKVEKFMDAVTLVRNRTRRGKYGTAMELVNEMRSATEKTWKFFELLSFANRDVDQQRQQMIEWTKGLIQDSFNEPLTKEQSEAVTKVLLKTDIAALLDTYSGEEIRNLLISEAYLKAEITRIEAELMKPQYKHGVYYNRQADALGMFMVDGIATSQNQMKNATTIAHLGGDVDLDTHQYDEAAADLAEPLIDQLATLRALRYTDSPRKNLVGQLMLNEPDGIEFVMRQSKALNEQAMNDLFGNNPINYIKGYTFDITNHFKTVEVVPVTDADEMIAKGFTPLHTIDRDPNDPLNDQMQMFVKYDGGTASYVSGIFSLTSRKAKGTAMAVSHMQAGNNQGFIHNRNNRNQVSMQRRQAVADLFDPSIPFDPITVKNQGQSLMVPILAHDGRVQNYHYLMSEFTKDLVLEKNNRVEDVLSALAGNIVDKVSTEESNNRTIDALYDMFNEDYTRNERAYLRISPQSSDPRLKEIWHMLPDEAKHHVQKTWGRPEMFVRNDILNMTFGYRSASIADVWNIDPEERKNWQRLLVTIAENVPGLKKDTASKIRMLGQGVEEIVKGVKDILVIKNLFTLVNNIISNTVLLSWSGVPFKEIIRSHKEGYEGVRKYQDDSKAKFTLENRLRTESMSDAQRKVIRGQIAKLDHDLATNPIAELVEAGLFQSIVEDIDQHEDTFSFKSKLSKELGSRTEFIPDTLVNAAKTITLSHDTPAYKFLNQSTQLSDFVARYTKYKYLTKQAAEPKSKQDAKRIVMEDFVMYDVPTSKALEYANSTGLAMFTKYYLRMQKPLLRLFRENPARGLWMLVGQNLLDYTAPTDSNLLTNSILSRVHNPFMTALGAPDEILWINGILHGTGIKD